MLHSFSFFKKQNILWLSENKIKLKPTKTNQQKVGLRKSSGFGYFCKKRQHRKTAIVDSLDST
jgi:hypothetical protein